MTQSYTKDEINYTRTINKSEKRKNRLEPGYDRVIPSYVADDRRISGQHRDVYSLIRAVCSRHGCCDIENWEFAAFLGISTATFKRYLKKLKDLEYVKIEIFNRYKRKIWMPEAYANRERNSKIFSPAQFCATPAQFCADNNIDINIDIRNNTKKQTAPLKEPIIPLFSYEWRNPKTGQMQKIENGVTTEEFEKLKSQLGETRIRSVCNMMKNYADNGNGTILFKDKNLYTKIIDWNRRAGLSKKEKEQKTKEKDLRQGEKPNEKPSDKPKEGGVMDQTQDRVEQYKSHEAKIVSKFIEQNPDLRDDIKIYENKIEVRNTVNKKRFDQIILPEPAIKQKLERWAEEFRDNRG